MVGGVEQDASGGQKAKHIPVPRPFGSEGDVLVAHQIFTDAFYTDVRRDLAGWREERGLPADPMAAYLASGYQEQIEADRVGGAQAGWN
jgi:L-rhamnose isomerase/sugar isomerase